MRSSGRSEMMTFSFLTVALAVALAGCATACKSKETVKLDENDKDFENDVALHQQNWGESVLLFNFEGKDDDVYALTGDNMVCKPSANPNRMWGVGASAMPTHEGLLMCGGQNNVDNQCCHWVKSPQADDLKVDYCLTMSNSSISVKDFPNQFVLKSDFVRAPSQDVFYAFASGMLIQGKLVPNPELGPGIAKIMWEERVPDEHLDFPKTGACLLVVRHDALLIGGENEHGELLNVSHAVHDADKSPEWSSFDGFPQIARKNAACFSDKKTQTVYVVGGKGEEGEVLTSIESARLTVVKENNSLMLDYFKLLPDELPQQLKNLLAVQLDKSDGHGYVTLIAGNSADDNLHVFDFDVVKHDFEAILDSSHKDIPLLTGAVVTVIKTVYLDGCQSASKELPSGLEDLFNDVEEKKFWLDMDA